MIIKTTYTDDGSGGTEVGTSVTEVFVGATMEVGGAWDSLTGTETTG